jgi:hypothetical protein
LFDLATPEGRQDFDGVLAFFDSPPESRLLMRRPEMERAFGNARVITDDNLGDEYPVSLTTFLRSLVPGL